LGANYIAVIFVLTHVGRLLEGQLNESEPGLLVGIILMVFVLRAIHFLKSKNSQFKTKHE
jgi:hypothetical protein